MTLLSPLNRAFTIESASKVIQPILEERGIELTTFFNVEQVDPAARTVTSIEGEKAEYDLLVLVPPHPGQSVVTDSDLGDPSGWLPTDRLTLQVKERDRIFAMGDGTDLPISKSGSTAHFEAPVVASRIASLVRGALEDQLRRSRHVLPGDGEPQGDRPAIRLRAPAHAAEASRSGMRRSGCSTGCIGRRCPRVGSPRHRDGERREP